MRRTDLARAIELSHQLTAIATFAHALDTTPSTALKTLCFYATAEGNRTVMAGEFTDQSDIAIALDALSKVAQRALKRTQTELKQLGVEED